MPNPNYRVEIADDQARPFDGTRLVSAVEMILADHDIEKSEFSIAIVDDPTIRKLNNTWLKHDYETDVLSFLLEYDPSQNYLSGQLIVSTDTAESVARELDIPVDDELLLYVVHGTLHLVGFDDKNPEDAAEMRAAEKDYLKQLGVDYCWPT